MAAFFGLTDILFLLLGYILVWSKDLAPSAKAGVGFLGLLGLMSVYHLFSPSKHGHAGTDFDVFRAGAGAIVTAVEISTLSETDFAGVYRPFVWLFSCQRLSSPRSV